LYEWLASQCVRHDAAWDCASGNGQAAVGLSRHFRRVLATDISAEQIAHGIPRKSIQYTVQSAEQTTFESNSFDLITVAQALHWFDYARFWPEVIRVARPGALFCAWGYDWFTTDAPGVDGAVVTPFRQIIAPFWAANNSLLWNGYRKEDVSFPFEPIECPSLSLVMEWRFEQLLEYMMTWSAFKLSRANSEAADAMDELLKSAGSIVTPETKVVVRMPLKMVAGRVPIA
jgi:ubiquinone/menaquinone biosynthesis C-methylase UbiE